jgi:hypothetical protein
MWIWIRNTVSYLHLLSSWLSLFLRNELPAGASIILFSVYILNGLENPRKYSIWKQFYERNPLSYYKWILAARARPCAARTRHLISLPRPMGRCAPPPSLSQLRCFYLSPKAFHQFQLDRQGYISFHWAKLHPAELHCILLSYAAPS